ncbi:hypothetical protein ACH4PR_51600 [Streptomyces mirabilis]|uniref:hypothetical protein n=1 Tax=Streptomyces mirabilis TaxID=68239 RepID=UPI0037AF1720
MTANHARAAVTIAPITPFTRLVRALVDRGHAATGGGHRVRWRSAACWRVLSRPCLVRFHYPAQPESAGSSCSLLSAG